MPDFEPLALTETNDDTTLSEPTALALLCEVATNEAPPPIRISRPRKRRTCQAVLNGMSCPIPYECKGRSNKADCALRTGGDPSKNVK